MTARRLFHCLFIFCALVSLTACGGSRPFSVLQICLHNDEDVAALSEILKAVAEENGLRFVDRAASTQRELAAQNSAPPYDLIYFGAIGSDGFGFEVSNLGLAQHEVAIGFSHGSDPEKDRQLVGSLIDLMGARWAVLVVSPDSGAKPSGCLKRGSNPQF